MGPGAGPKIRNNLVEERGGSNHPKSPKAAFTGKNFSTERFLIL